MRIGTFHLLAVLAGLAMSGPAMAEQCMGNAEALGTARVLALNTSQGLSLGQQYGYGLPLADKEIVLTFDDGPLPVFSEQVQKILKKECARATFFLVGRNASAYPAFVRSLAADGHTIASHTMTHHMNLGAKPLAFGENEIKRGIEAIDRALKTSLHQSSTAPFFRFPGLDDNPALREKLQAQGISVFDIDIEGGDWLKDYTAKNVHDRVMAQLREKGKGIVLLHDIQPRTVKMLPQFLRTLKKEGYKIVHLVPAPKSDLTIAAVKPADLQVPNTKIIADTKTASVQYYQPETLSDAVEREKSKPQELAQAELFDADDKPVALGHTTEPLSEDIETALADAKREFATDAPKHKPRQHRSASRRRQRQQHFAAASSSYLVQHKRPASSQYLLNSIFNSLRVN